VGSYTLQARATDWAGRTHQPATVPSTRDSVVPGFGVNTGARRGPAGRSTTEAHGSQISGDAILGLCLGRQGFTGSPMPREYAPPLPRVRPAQRDGHDENRGHLCRRLGRGGCAHAEPLTPQLRLQRVPLESPRELPLPRASRSASNRKATDQGGQRDLKSRLSE
jgi:hypothetical protein